MNWWDNFTGALGRAWNGTPSTLQASYPEGSWAPGTMPIPGQPVQTMHYLAEAPGANSWFDGYGSNSAYSNQVSPTITGAPATGGLKGWLSNGQNLGTVIQGFGTVAQAYLGWQAMKQAKQQLNFQKEAFNANLNNSISSYNTSLEDKIRGRTSNYEGKEADVQAYLAKHSLKR